MPCLDKREKSGPKVKAVAQFKRRRLEKLIGPDNRRSWREARKWEIETREKMKREWEAAQKTATVCSKTDLVTLLMTFTEYLDFAKRQYTKKVYKEKHKCFKDIVKHFGPDREIGTITPKEAAAFLAKVAETRSGYSTNKIAKNFNACWRWAEKFVDHFPEKRNPFLVVPKQPEVKTPRYVPPKKDFEKVLDVVTGQDWVLLQTFYYTAGRRSEVYGMTWKDLDFEANTVGLWTKKRSGGRREYDLIPMVSELREILLKWKAEQPVETEYVFLNMKPQSAGYMKPFTDRIRFMRKICKDAGVKYFGFHAIRHLTATQLFHAGQPVHVIQQMLRHKNPNTTARYLHSLGLNKALQAIDGTF